MSPPQFHVIIDHCFTLISSCCVSLHQSHVHDHARSPKGGFHHHHLVHVGMFQDSPKDERRVPHIDQIITFVGESQISSVNTLPFMLYLISIPSSSYLTLILLAPYTCELNLIKLNPRIVAEIPFADLSHIPKLSVRMWETQDGVSECVILQSLCTLSVILCLNTFQSDIGPRNGKC